MSGKDEKPKIAVLEDEPPREEPELDPPESGAEQLKRGSKVAGMFAAIFGLVIVCAAPATGYMIWSQQPDVGGKIVVVPFVQQGADDSAGDALTAELITSLQSNKEFDVVSKAETMKLKGDPRKVDEIGKSFGAMYVVQGELKTTPKKANISVSMVDVNKGGALFTERFKGDIGDISKLEDEIADLIRQKANIPGYEAK